MPSTPWFIGYPGAKHSAEVARVLGYVAAGGGEGVVRGGDMKVVPYTVPGTGVNIRTGGCAIQNRHSGGGSQMYLDFIKVQEDLELSGTGTGQTRSDLIIRRVEDPQYPGWPVPDEPGENVYGYTRVITGVPPSTTDAADLNLGYPALALARIDWPAATATVTAGMIKDLRKLIHKRRERHLEVAYPTGGPSVGGVQPLTSSSFVTWPSQADWQIYVPEWATKAFIRGQVESYVVKGNNANGRLRSAFAGVGGQQTSYDENWTGNPHRNGLTFLAQHNLVNSPGETKPIRFQGMRSSGSGYIDADTYTTCLLDVEFVEDVL